MKQVDTPMKVALTGFVCAKALLMIGIIPFTLHLEEEKKHKKYNYR